MIIPIRDEHGNPRMVEISNPWVAPMPDLNIKPDNREPVDQDHSEKTADFEKLSVNLGVIERVKRNPSRAIAGTFGNRYVKE